MHGPASSNLPQDPNARRRRLLSRVAMAAGGITSAGLGTAAYVVRAITRASKASPYDHYGYTPYEVGIAHEDVRIPSRVGDSLSGWWLPRPETQRAILVCYGYRNRKADTLGISAALWRSGYNVLIFDYHGHGEHVGTPVSLGYREADDALDAVAYLCRRLPGARLGAIGYSMGASIAIMAAARDRRIEAVVADSPFAAQRNPVLRQLRRQMHISLGGRLLLDVADLLLYRRFGYRFRDVEPLREVPALGQRPLLLIHGLNDTVIDAHDSELLYEAASGPKQFWQVPNCEHCGAYFADRHAYVRRVTAFFNQALGGDGIGDPAVEKVQLEEDSQGQHQDQHQQDSHQRRPGPRLIRLVQALLP